MRCDEENNQHQLINQYFIFYLYESVSFMINWINNVHKFNRNQHFSMEIFPKQSNVAHLQIIIVVLNFFLFESKNKNKMLSFCCFSIKLAIYLIVVKKSRCYCVSKLPTTPDLPPSERTLKLESPIPIVTIKIHLNSHVIRIGKLKTSTTRSQIINNGIYFDETEWKIKRSRFFV